MSNFQPLPAGGPNVNPVEHVDVAVIPPERRSLPNNIPVPDQAVEKPPAPVVPAEVPSIQSQATTDEPSESHALAQEDHDEKGAAQEDHDYEIVKDLGWNQHPSMLPNLVGGLPNEELWTLVRRFDKVWHRPPVQALRTDQSTFSKCTMSRRFRTSHSVDSTSILLILKNFRPTKCEVTLNGCT